MIKINRVKLVLFLKTWFLLRFSSATTQPIFFKGVMHDILSPEGSCKRSGILEVVKRLGGDYNICVVKVVPSWGMQKTLVQAEWESEGMAAVSIGWLDESELNLKSELYNYWSNLQGSVSVL